MVEKDMRPTITKWLNHSGYYDAHECLVAGWVDVIGCKWSECIGRKRPELLEMICIELKMRDIAIVIDQARCNLHHCNLSYCAMPADFCGRMRNSSFEKFKKAGVGLLSVAADDVKVLIHSTFKNEIVDVIFRNRLWDFRNRHLSQKQGKG